ncbi:tripartite tricarboxylate transporter permease [Brevibacterium sp. BDJS002]|uniref:tripartite tricarboxylate transporter permease n=1 Tax=Brevibacterium sp. BDJS002 TaxID=3020906 RepID=UPI0023076E91|nr:tripartite tricarboxylate transporter permease [Brevibacterium sp. BDJS002]WCE40347.1 tripartite tricarboxylate transporter permease [Brevibacterium sp. BDJS002]
MIDNLMLGLETAVSPENLLWCFVGVLLGTVIGLLPGLGSTTGVAILLPVTLAFEPVTALIMLAGIYYGSQYGSSISSILISTPGDASSVVLTLDGYQMARKGRAGAALAISALASFFAAIISLIGLMALAQPIAHFALNFGPAENLAIILLGMATIVSFAGENILRGITMAAAGLLVSMVGVASGFSTARFTFGSVNLLSGLDFVAVMIGIFAVGEVLHQIRRGGEKPIRARFKDLLVTKEELTRSAPAATRGTLLGFAVGVLPGAGATLATFLAYGVEKQVSKFKHLIGKGAPEAVASPEAANNAAANASFIPTLALGIPGSGTTAVLLGAFVIFGLQPGPLLFQQEPDLVWGLLVSFFFGNLILLVLNLPLAPVFAQILRIPYVFLYPIVLMMSFVGAFALGNNTFTLWIVFFSGLLGYFMKRFDFPAAPFVLGLVLGPLLEKYLVQTSAMGDGNLFIMFQRPFSLILTVAALIALAYPLVSAVIRNLKTRKADAAAKENVTQ